jgi:hypothetical protein
MDVEAAEGRDVEEGLREDLAVGGDDDKVGGPEPEGVDEAGVAGAGGLEDREAAREGLDLHRGRLQLEVASGGLVRLGDDADDGP